MIPLQDALAMINFRNSAGAPDFGRQPTPGEPLMIELQGDRYVRVNKTAAGADAQPIASPGSNPGITSAPRAQDLPPAVLIFRDGHSEQVRDYTIADGALYARGDYYSDGYWNKKIDLASLNVPETLQANAERNVKFILPSSPNEVIARF